MHSPFKAEVINYKGDLNTPPDQVKFSNQRRKNNLVSLPGVQGSVQESEQGADRGNFQEIWPDGQRQAELPGVPGHDGQAVGVEGQDDEAGERTNGQQKWEGGGKRASWWWQANDFQQAELPGKNSPRGWPSKSLRRRANTTQLIIKLHIVQYNEKWQLFLSISSFYDFYCSGSE